MGQSHQNILEVQKCAQKYYQINGHGFTAPDLHRYMMNEVDISKPTVRSCLDELVSKGYLDKTEISQTGFYVVDESLLPQPAESDMYAEADQFW